MINFKKPLFYLTLSGYCLVAGLACAQLEDSKKNVQGNRAPAAVGVKKQASVFSNKPQVVLFKIHDIKPVVDADGTTTACEYTATFFNRTPVSLRQAKIEFGWTDHISELFPIDEDAKTATDKQDNKKKQEGLGSILSSVDLPALGSLKQISVHGVVQTDKCFALLDNLKFNVPVCNILGQENSSDSRRGRNVEKDQPSCAGLFAYVNSKHPEYYGEFKEISYEEQVEQEKTQEEKENEMIASINNSIEKNIDDTNLIMNNIK